jgi:endonuclease/exonuclease/phosphatase family metal-dependent hydrolase
MRVCRAFQALVSLVFVSCQAPPEPTRLRVVTWNVENFFNDRRDSPELAVEPVASAADYRRKLLGAVETLRELDADLVLLQEIENEAVTAALGDALGGYPHRSTTRGNDPRGIDLAVLSRVPIRLVRDHSDEWFEGPDGAGPFSFARDCQELHLTLAGSSVIVLGVHYKALGDAASRQKRAAEAERTRQIADELRALEPATPLLIAGDFNAEPDAPELAAFGERDTAAYDSLVSSLPAGERATFGSGTAARSFDDQRLSGHTPLAAPVSVQVVSSRRVLETSDHRPLLVDYALHTSISCSHCQ